MMVRQPAAVPADDPSPHRVLVNGAGLKVTFDGRDVYQFGDAVADWGAGYRWFKLFEVYDVEFSARASERIVQAVGTSGRLLLVDPFDVATRGRDLCIADNVVAVLPNFLALSTTEQTHLAERLRPGSMYGADQCLKAAMESEHVGVSIAGLARIIVDGRLLLMRQHGVYIPLGGALQYAAPDDRKRLEELGARHFLEDGGIQDYQGDLRFVLPSASLPALLVWWDLSRRADALNPRVERHPVRELREEMTAELGIFDGAYFDALLEPRLLPPYAPPPPYVDTVSRLFTGSPHERESAVSQVRAQTGEDRSLGCIGKLSLALDDPSADVRRAACAELIRLLPRHMHALPATAAPILDTLVGLSGASHQRRAPCRSLTTPGQIRAMLRHLSLECAPPLAEELLAARGDVTLLSEDYTYDPGLARDGIDIAMVVKREENFREREFRHNARVPRNDLIGRARWRPYYQGRVIDVDLSGDRLSEMVREHASLPYLEPYDVVTMLDGTRIVGVANGVLVQSQGKADVEISHPWLAQVHSVEVGGDRLLVASSGYDCVVEFSLRSGEVLWSWHASDHMVDAALLGVQQSRTDSTASALRGDGLAVADTSDPSLWGRFGLPTAIRLHLNEAHYLPDGCIAVSLAHLGAILTISRTGEAWDVIASGLQAPHGFTPHQNGLLGADTRRGRALFWGCDRGLPTEIRVEGMEGRTGREISGTEWLQKVVPLSDSLVLLVDEARNMLWLVDTIHRRYRGIETLANWRIHSVRPVRLLQSNTAAV